MNKLRDEDCMQYYTLKVLVFNRKVGYNTVITLEVLGKFSGFVLCHKDERRKKQNCIEIYTILGYTDVAFL